MHDTVKRLTTDRFERLTADRFERLARAGEFDERRRTSLRRALDGRRLSILRILAAETGSVTFEELGERVAVEERGQRRATERVGGDGEPSCDRRSIELYHVDVPLLSDLGLVAYDEGREGIRLTERGVTLLGYHSFLQ